MSSPETLLQFLYDGNFIGFIQAIYVMAFQSADLFYGVVSMFFFVAFYVKTHSLLFLVVIWLCVGSFIIVAMPILSNLAVLFCILGVAGLLFRLYVSYRG